MGEVNKLFVFKSLTRHSNVLPLHLKQTFPPIIWIFTQVEEDEIESKWSSKISPIIWIFTEGEGDGIESMLSSKSFLLYQSNMLQNMVRNDCSKIAASGIYKNLFFFRKTGKNCRRPYGLSFFYSSKKLSL